MLNRFNLIRIFNLRIIFSLLFLCPLTFAGETDVTNFPGSEELPVQSLSDAEREMLQKSGFGKELQQYETQKNATSTDQKIESQPTVQTKTPDFTPSMAIADDAFINGDYETALKHYEALGKKGDSKASMAAGLIHAEGAKGVEVDKAKAAAWLKRSEGQGDSSSADLYEKMDNKGDLSGEDRLKAEKLIREFAESDSKLANKEQTIPSINQVTHSRLSYSGDASNSGNSKIESAQFSHANQNIALEFVINSYVPERSSSGEFSYSPGKGNLDHYLPEKE